MESLYWYRQKRIEQMESKQQIIDSQEFRSELEKELKDMEDTAFLARASNQGWGDTISKLVHPSNLRPFLILLALFFFYPISGVYNISFFAVSLFEDLGLGGAETVAVFTALVRCLGTVASTLLLLR